MRIVAPVKLVDLAVGLSSCELSNLVKDAIPKA